MQRDLAHQPLVMVRGHRRLEKLLPALDAGVLAHQRLPAIEGGEVPVTDEKIIPQAQAVGRVLAALDQYSLVVTAQVDLGRPADRHAGQGPADITQPVRGHAEGPQVVPVDPPVEYTCRY